MKWINLTSEEQLLTIHKSDKTIVLFKHSTRCPVSGMAKRSLEFDADLIPDQLDFYYLDLITYRDLSNQIAELWNIIHESPQIIVVKGEKLLYHASHSDIEMRDIVQFTS